MPYLDPDAQASASRRYYWRNRQSILDKKKAQRVAGPRDAVLARPRFNGRLSADEVRLALQGIGTKGSDYDELLKDFAE